MLDETQIEKVKFIENAQPQLESGAYSLTTRQTVKGPDNILPETSYANPKKFNVNGERFALNPDDIVSVFPPSFSLGEYTNVLPHIVLGRITLPWERNAGDGKTPWLGIVVFNESDSHPIPKRKEVELLELLPKSDHTKDNTTGKLEDHYFFPPFPSPKDKTYKELEYGEHWNDKCHVIDLKREQFIALLPTAEDQRWLSHVREVEIENKSENYIQRVRSFFDDPAGPVKLADVVGNRFPTAGKNTTVHLVSLESFGDYLPKTDGTSTIPDTYTHVRMVSLWSWNFSSISKKQTFIGLLSDVNKTGTDAPQCTLNVPYKGDRNSEAQKAVANAMDQGLAAFNHRTRMGDRTVSWYHGPFVPYKPNYAIHKEAPVNTADALTRYNPDAGMFDVSYSGAWQLGRLMALQNQHFAITLYNYKRGLSQAIIKKLENEFLDLSWSRIAEIINQGLKSYVDSPIITEKTIQRKKRPTQEEIAAHLHSVMTDADALSTILDEEPLNVIPQELSNWLARLKLLYGVPFNYIVPDYRMMPNDSLRFFYLDDEWFDNLLEGAMSLGRSTTSDEAVHKAILPHIRKETAREKKAIRKRLFGRDQTEDASDDIATGFLLKSQVVSGWPGLEVRVKGADDKELEILRLDHMGPDVLLCIYHGEAKEVQIRQQGESLHFGVHLGSDGTDPQQYNKTLRYIDAKDGNAPGTTIDPSIAPALEIKNFYRNGSSLVVKIDDLAKAIKSELGTSIDYQGGFTSSEFALEMVEGIQVVTYTFKSDSIQSLQFA